MGKMPSNCPSFFFNVLVCHAVRSIKYAYKIKAKSVNCRIYKTAYKRFFNYTLYDILCPVDVTIDN
jgi:hypothetical protein